jgi:hypothetical protein
MNMVIQPIKQLEAEYTTVTETYDVILSVKKGLKDCKKDKFNGLKLSKTHKKKFETAAIKVYERALSYLRDWFDFMNRKRRHLTSS